MKSNELRIGNIVNYLGNETSVNSISVGYVSTVSSGVITENQISEILLTEEWLLKLGFESCSDDGYTTDFNLNGFVIINGLNTDGEEFFVEDKSGVHVFHIHQLQNLYFALTGEELKITD